MPVTSSAIKKAKQDKKARERNRLVRDDYKKASKEVRKLVNVGDFKKANVALVTAYSKLDKAAKRNILHPNNASRRKARLAALIGKNEKVTKKPPLKTKEK
ncbi:30S ribosomal protein S20 [Patescibacteria group bacterium]|nr:30S ribosomal protein S20 [Patescibacteria group bacterium]